MNPKELIEFMKISEKLKCNTRHSWTSNDRHESVAEHTFHLAFMAELLREEFPEVHMDKVIRMCLWHDMGEAITGDIPAFMKTEEHEKTELNAIDNIIQKLPQSMRLEIKELFQEMFDLKSIEAKVYKALDKMETINQHNEANIKTWIPIEYQTNLEYGQEQVEFSAYMKQLKLEIKNISLNKIADDKRNLNE